MARYVQKTATISAGQSLSNVIDCSTGAPVLVYVPQLWTPSRLSFQVSPDGTNFYDLFDQNALEIAFNVAAGTAVLLALNWAPLLYFKVRSGSRDLAVSQQADRPIIVTIDTSAAVV
jgi:hypothetical protein